MLSKSTLLGSVLILLGAANHPPFFAEAEEVYFNDGGKYNTSQTYPSHNIFVMNGTTLSLVEGHLVTAPPDGKSGEDAIRVEDSTFYAKSGSIYGGLGVGGSGVTVTTNRNSGFQGKAVFEAGVEVYGGDAIRQTTTKGGDAVQILHDGSEALFNGGVFTPGAGCSIQVCGQPTSDGNSLQVLYGKAIIMGGDFTGNFYSEKGTIEVHGCVKFNGEKITGVLSDGSNIDVTFSGGENDVSVVYSDSTCPPSTETETETPNNKAVQEYSAKFVVFTSLVMGYFITSFN